MWPVEERSADYLFSGMVQHSPDGRLAFYHRAGHDAKFHPYRCAASHHVLKAVCGPTGSTACMLFAQNTRMWHIGGR